MAQWPRTASAKSAAESARRRYRIAARLDFVAALDVAFDHGDGGELRKTRGARKLRSEALPVDDVGDRMHTDLKLAVVLADRLDLLNLAGRRGVEITS